MSIDYNTKIDKINNDRILMLKIIKEKIVDNNNSLSKNLDNVINLMNFDEKATKEYTAIMKAKQLIFELTEEIVNANSIEEVISLRKKINYYINKIKKVMISKNIQQEELNVFSKKTIDLRKKFSLYIRFLKREKNINEIYNLSKNLDTLTQEDYINLKKLLTNELKYNRNLIKSINNVDLIPTKINSDSNEEKVIKVSEELTSQIEESSCKFNIVNNTDINNCSESNEETIENSISLQNEQIEKMDLSLDSLTSLINECTTLCTEVVENNDEYVLDEEFLIERIEYYFLQYKFLKLFSYDGNFFRRGLNFFKNIPRYLYNKRIVRTAEFDYNTFYHGRDFRDFISYAKKRNSIKTGLSFIFRDSYLSKREAECLNNHNKCKEWILEFNYSDSMNYYSPLRLVK